MTTSPTIVPVLFKAAGMVGLAVIAALVHQRFYGPISTSLKSQGVDIPLVQPPQIPDQTRGIRGSGDGAGVTVPVTKPDTAPVTTPSLKPEAAKPVTPAQAAAPHDDSMINTEQAVVLYNAGMTQWVDAREPDEYRAGHIPGATLLSVSSFNGQNLTETDQKINMRLNRGLNVVVYCGGGACDASKLVAQQLQARGFNKIAVYHDGWNGWSAAKLPAESGDEAPPGMPPMPPPALPGGQP